MKKSCFKPMNKRYPIIPHLIPRLYPCQTHHKPISRHLPNSIIVRLRRNWRQVVTCFASLNARTAVVCQAKEKPSVKPSHYGGLFFICRNSCQISDRVNLYLLIICMSYFWGILGGIFIKLLMLVSLPHQLSAGFRHVAALLLEPAVTTCWGNPADSQSAGTSHLGICLNHLKLGVTNW